MELLAAFLVALVGAANLPPSVAVKTYEGYKLLKVVPEDDTTVNMLRDMMANNVELDFFEEPSRPGSSTTFLVPPEHTDRVESYLADAGVRYEVQIENMGTVLQPTLLTMRRSISGQKSEFDLDDFNTLENIYEWLLELARKCRPGLRCKYYSIGDSYEGRPIYMFKMSKPGSGRKAYWIDATIHAREWITTTTITNIMDRLATGASDDAVRLTDAYDWYFIPVVNPDGYRYTWTNDRLWRKNRRPFAKPCVGVDLNRNFKHNWGHEGVSRDPCSEIFCGTRAGSEPETAALSSEFIRLGPRLAGALTLHAYGRMWLLPWDNSVNFDGRTCEFASDHDQLMAVANAAADAIESTYGTDWTRGNICDVIYPVTGSSISFAKAAAGVKYVFGAELRGSSFVVDASEIPLSFEEIWNGVVAMCDAIEAQSIHQ